VDIYVSIKEKMLQPYSGLNGGASYTGRRGEERVSQDEKHHGQQLTAAGRWRFGQEKKKV